MRSIIHDLHLGFFASLGISLMLLFSGCMNAQTVVPAGVHSTTQALTNCAQVQRRFTASLDFSNPKPSDFTNPSLPPPSDLMPSVVFHLHYPNASHTQHPSLYELGCLLDEQLGKLINEHPNDMPARFRFFPGAIISALMEPLDRKLVEPGANWDVKRGLPRHGQLGSVLDEELKQVLQKSPIAKVFEAHGYRLSVKGIMGGIDIQPVKALHGAKLPVSVYAIDMIATKISK
jgi:hypothetical protein